jgi:hypothetical protein
MAQIRDPRRIGLIAGALWLLAPACDHKLVPGPSTAEEPSPGDGGNGPGAPTLVLPDAGAADANLAPRPPISGQACVEQTLTGEMVPLDLQLVLDASGSMRVLVGGQTRWQQVAGALEKFLGDPRSAGLGVGLQTFPFTIVQKPCTTDADCQSLGTGPQGVNYWCARPFVCGGTGVSLVNPRSCDPNDSYCPDAGTACVMAGRCSRSGAVCLGIGQPCAGANGGNGGMTGDVCGQAPTVCKMPIDSCRPDDYQSPRVPIAEVPAGVAPLMQGLASVKPGGNTPITAAVTGAATYLRSYLASHPGHRGALVLGTDVAPSGCDGDNVEAVAAVLASARQASPPISTYVIGALSPTDTVRSAAAARLAEAGGTREPFIVNDSAADLGNRFLEALSRIRGSALACEFRIPTPTSGVVDYGRVNIRFTGSQGPQDLGYVGSAAGCAAGKDGWYYDVDPAQGLPMTVQVCESTCARFKAEGAGAIELLFGCLTRVD